jgi:hypothetical protein
MWRPDRKNGSWVNIYSLQAFDRVQISYPEVRQLVGLSPEYPFRGLDVLGPEQSAAALEALGITVSAPRGTDAEEARRLALLSRNTGKVVPTEKFTSTGTTYQQPGRTIHVNRAESQLITAYRDSHPDDENMTLQCGAGRADYYAKTPDGGVIIEAKSSARHLYVRQALSQLLDYVRYADAPVAWLGALFPQCPDPDGVELLHRYGIDCLYLDQQGHFASRKPPEHFRAIWR